LRLPRAEFAIDRTFPKAEINAVGNLRKPIPLKDGAPVSDPARLEYQRLRAGSETCAPVLQRIQLEFKLENSNSTFNFQLLTFNR
jgi:hypothetical protein